MGRRLLKAYTRNQKIIARSSAEAVQKQSCVQQHWERQQRRVLRACSNSLFVDFDGEVSRQRTVHLPNHALGGDWGSA